MKAENNRIFVLLAQKNNLPIALPSNGHLHDITGDLAHKSAAESFLNSSASYLPKATRDQIIDAVGFIGHILRINEEDGTFWVQCACGATYIAKINDFSNLNEPPSSDKFSRF